MKSCRFTSILLAGLLAALFLLPGCTDSDTVKLEKEKIQYQDKVQQVADNLNRKIAELRSQAEGAGLQDSLAADSALQVRMAEMEQLHEDLLVNLGKIDNASEEEWPQLKARLDELINAYTRAVQVADTL